MPICQSWDNIHPLIYLILHVCFPRDSRGAEKSGLVCAALSLLEALENNAYVDVFNVVKRIRRSRPQFIATLVSINWNSTTDIMVMNYKRTRSRLNGHLHHNPQIFGKVCVLPGLVPCIYVVNYCVEFSSLYFDAYCNLIVRSECVTWYWNINVSFDNINGPINQVLLEDDLFKVKQHLATFPYYIEFVSWIYLTVLICKCNYVKFRKLLWINIDWLIDWSRLLHSVLFVVSFT